MKHAVYTILGLICVTSLFLLGNATPAVAKETPETAPVDTVPRTLAILPFENNSITNREQYAPLSKGLSAMLITDLSQGGTSLKLIERGKIQSLLKEIALGQTGSVDESTAIRAGKMLGAQSIAFGSFMVLGNNVRIDTRIVNVETSELIMAESIQGESKDFMSLERGLARKIASALKVAFSPGGTIADSGINAAVYFSMGLDAVDRGDTTEAKQLFQKCIQLDPAYRIQVDNVQGSN